MLGGRIDIGYSGCTHPTCIANTQVPPDGSTCAWVTSVVRENEFGEVDYWTYGGGLGKPEGRGIAPGTRGKISIRKWHKGNVASARTLGSNDSMLSSGLVLGVKLRLMAGSRVRMPAKQDVCDGSHGHMDVLARIRGAGGTRKTSLAGA